MTIDRILKHHSGEAPLPEPETIGDWAGHTPKTAQELLDADVEGSGVIMSDEFFGDNEEELRASYMRDEIVLGVRALVTLSGDNSRDHGFHDDWPVDPGVPAPSEAQGVDLRRAIAEKLALIHEEISEALGEIRSGHDPLETYFQASGSTCTVQVHDDEGKPQYKPEGFLVELADAVIRIADLVYLVGGRAEFVNALEIKHRYNATRPYKHGRKF